MLNILLGCKDLVTNIERTKLVDTCSGDLLITGTDREINSILSILIRDANYTDNKSNTTLDNFTLNKSIILNYDSLNIITSSSHAERCHRILRTLGFTGRIQFSLVYDGKKER